MKSKPSYLITVFSFATLLCLISCMQEEVLESQKGKGTFSIVGNPVQARLSIAVGCLSFGVGTRAEEPVSDYDGEDSEEERHVDDLWLFEYSQSSGELIYMPQQVIIGSQEELTDIEVTLSDNYGKPVTIYVVANSGSGVSENSANWVVSETVGDDVSYPGFMTFEELEANTIPTPHPQRMTWDEVTETYVLDTQDAASVSIPMSGYLEDVTVEEGADILLSVSRMFAKLLVRVDLSDFNADDYASAWLSTVTVGNIPEYCTVGTLWDGDRGDSAQPANYAACGQWIRRTFNAVGETSGDTGGTGNDDGAVYPYLIYVPENIQGENGSSTDKAENVPDGYALTVTAGIYVETTSGATLGEYTSFVAYPGGNSTTNFNVRRNCLYRVTMRINDLVDDILPSANCIVCLSGETTAFFPYCREEAGGGYDFEDYLYAYDDGAKAGQKIDHVGIIWQRHKDSDNSAGYIGDNSSNRYVWIDDLDAGEAIDEYHRRIHVTIPDGEIGNALIGAYNSDDEVIWSWHIWSREAENDPRTVNIKLYYTYDWDSSGIYDLYSGRPRVAAYTIMNCNLGALADEPTSYPSDPLNDTSTEPGNLANTFGTMYQWGRKDPFPPQANTFGSYNCNYETGYVGRYYDNADSQVSMTTGEQSASGELFYSVPGENREQDFNTALLNSIQNPTAFYCGTNLADQSSSYNGTSASTETEAQEILTTNYPFPHDGNWIYDSDGDHLNRLWGGLDPEKDYMSKSYDTGLFDLCGNQVHFYDDYGEKSIFDPCPYGWRVSPPDLWLGFTDTGLNTDGVLNEGWTAAFDEINYDSSRSCYYGFTMYLTDWRAGDTSFFPHQGVRLPSGDLLRAGQCGNYNNATSDLNDRVNIMHLHFYPYYFRIFELGILPYFLKSTASPVRCVRIDSVQQ